MIATSYPGGAVMILGGLGAILFFVLALILAFVSFCLAPFGKTSSAAQKFAIGSFGSYGVAMLFWIIASYAELNDPEISGVPKAEMWSGSLKVVGESLAIPLVAWAGFFWGSKTQRKHELKPQ